MADDRALTELLMQLDGIANAPMTAEQREKRAQALLDAAGVSVAEIADRVFRLSLPWNREKANEAGVGVQTWLIAMRTVCRKAAQSVTDLLDCLHKAEAAVQMLKAGYSSGRDDKGGLTWTRS